MAREGLLVLIRVTSEHCDDQLQKQSSPNSKLPNTKLKFRRVEFNEASREINRSFESETYR